MGKRRIRLRDACGDGGTMGVRTAHALAPTLPAELVRLVMAHGAAMVVQRAARRRLGRRMRAAARRRQKDAREQRAMRFIASFAFGSVPMTGVFDDRLV